MASVINEALKNLNLFAANARGLLALQDELEKLGGWDKLAKEAEAKASTAKAGLAAAQAAWDEAQAALKDKQTELAGTVEQGRGLAKAAGDEYRAAIAKARDDAALIVRDAEAMKVKALADADNAASAAQAKVVAAETDLADLAGQIKAAGADLATIIKAKPAVETEISRLKFLFGGS